MPSSRSPKESSARSSASAALATRGTRPRVPRARRRPLRVGLQRRDRLRRAWRRPGAAASAGRDRPAKGRPAVERRAEPRRDADHRRGARRRQRLLFAAGAWRRRRRQRLGLLAAFCAGDRLVERLQRGAQGGDLATSGGDLLFGIDVRWQRACCRALPACGAVRRSRGISADCAARRAWGRLPAVGRPSPHGAQALVEIVEPAASSRLRGVDGGGGDGGGVGAHGLQVDAGRGAGGWPPAAPQGRAPAAARRAARSARRPARSPRPGRRSRRRRSRPGRARTQHAAATGGRSEGGGRRRWCVAHGAGPCTPGCGQPVDLIQHGLAGGPLCRDGRLERQAGRAAAAAAGLMATAVTLRQVVGELRLASTSRRTNDSAARGEKKVATSSARASSAARAESGSASSSRAS